MIAVSDQDIKDLGGLKSTMSNEEFIDLQGSFLKKPIESKQAPVVQRGSLSYCEQTPWIRNQTIRDNILFEKPMNETRYV